MNPILLQVFNRPWYIDRKHAADLKWAVSALMDGKLVFEADRESFKPQMVSGNYPSNDQQTTKKTGNVAIIPIQGVLMQKDQDCGPVGMETMAAYIKEANVNPQVDAIILDVNSPGGSVAGTANLGKAIAETTKPIIAFVNELAASAAYWASSQCDLIVASDKHAEVGSIGVQLNIMDMQPYYESLGVKFHDIVSNLSPLKNQDFRDIKDGNYDKVRTEMLDPLAARFIEEVKSARGKIKDEDLLKGEVVYADYAIETGLVDQIASFEETVQLALQMAEKNIANTPNAIHTKTQISSMKKRPLLLAALGVDALEESDGGSFLNEAQLDATEAQLAAHQTALDAVTAERDQANASLQAANDRAVQDVTALNETNASLTEQVNALTAENATLKGNAAEAGASIMAKTEVIDKPSGNEFLIGLEACGNDTKAKMAYIKQYGL